MMLRVLLEGIVVAVAAAVAAVCRLLKGHFGCY
jgi:hypothetical protein